MPFADRNKQREYSKNWIATRRAEWLSLNGPCSKCGSNEKLQIHYPDIAAKVEHRVWSWNKDRRDAELKKCIVLCRSCWFKARNDKNYAWKRKHGTELMYDKGKCRCRLCKDAHALGMRKYRGDHRNMSISSTLKKLEQIKDGLYREIDSLSSKIESDRNYLLDIETTIRTLKSINDVRDEPIVGVAKNHVLVMDPAPYRTDDHSQNQVEEPEPEETPEEEPEPDKTPNKESYKSGGIKHINNRKSILYGKRQAPPPPKLSGTQSVLNDDFYCDRCKTKFMSQGALDAHNDVHHKNNPDPTKCPVINCKLKFGSVTEMENHIITHHPKYARDYGYGA